MNAQHLPATGQAKQELVLLHGWSSDQRVWRPMLEFLRCWANVTVLDLPGCAPGLSCEDDLDVVCEAVMAATPPRAVYMGWSLGGQLVIALAVRFPQRVTAVLTLCSNPKFVADSTWPGMNVDAFGQFKQEVEQHPAAALRRFDSLQSAGAPQPRVLRRALQRLRDGAPPQLLSAGLTWLEDLDFRIELQALPQPQLHLLAPDDGLVPANIAAALERLLADNTKASVHLIDSGSHAVLLEAPEEIAACAERFLADAGLLDGICPPFELLDKADVAKSFSRAAREYDSVAQLQRDVGYELLQRLDDWSLKPQTVLDLGSGTGYFYPALRTRYPGAQYIGLDLAEGMSRFAQEQFPDRADWLVADAEALPLATSSIDLVFSSLAVQWCYQPHVLFTELARVLRPGGRCVFSSLGPGTLCELRDAWAAVDEHQHVNEFLPPEMLKAAAAQSRCLSLELDSTQYRMEYQQVRELLHELKTLGAHNVNRKRLAGLTGRRTLQGMLRAYEARREDDVLPATYEVLFGVMEKL